MRSPLQPQTQPPPDTAHALPASGTLPDVASAIAGVEHAIVRSAGHAITLDQPEESARAAEALPLRAAPSR